MAHLETMPAVEVAHPGASYRPDEKQHKELINKAGAEYAMKLRKNEEYSEFKNFRGLQATDGLNECAAIIAEEIEQERANLIARMELARANQDSDDEDEDEDKAVADGVEDDKTIIDSDEEMEVELPTTSKDPKRKTRADRNRQRRLGKEKAEKFEAKALKKKLIQVDKAKWLNRVVDQEAIEAEVVVEHKRKLAHEKSLKPLKKIGKFKVPQLLEAVKLTEDLPSSLRQLQPEGNGFSEVFNSLMKRNLVEPEVAFSQKEAKLKVKMTEKWSYKDFK
ncbi:hypothetical protein LPJ66_012060 [Kickxella alabastrina]|uniref:Uncharacterized protein n=1 Tax=Kickxella alabastrina TaxID=61397 RepID=A0ACC1HVY8_9FUNG|nr:hypothetical protein LPJ66_012060 [Kickxella alabastrina]